MIFKFHTYRAALIWMLFGLALPSWATSFVEQPFPETVQDAPVIVRGKIGKTGADWGKAVSGEKRIYTISRLEVQEVFKGVVSEKLISIRELGGEKDGIGMHVSGASHFEPGEDVVVFLGPRNEEGSYDVHGLMMGKYNIKLNSSGKEILEGPGISFSPEGKVKGQNDPDSAREWSLDSLRKVIQEQQKNALARPNPQKPEAIPPSPHPALPPMQPVPTTSPAAAPQLQFSPSEELKDSPEDQRIGRFFSPFMLMVLGLGVLAAGWILRRRK